MHRHAVLAIEGNGGDYWSHLPSGDPSLSHSMQVDDRLILLIGILCEARRVRRHSSQPLAHDRPR